jgi:deazaflavin-dependent oxidoreductase (nitroreductase family)
MNPTTRTLPRSTAADDAPLPLSIRVLRRFNPAIRWILGSPLHGLLSGNLLSLTYVGAKSGKRRTVPLSYVTVGGRLYLCTRSSLWWRNLRGGRPVEIRLRGRRVAATPEIIDLNSTEALDALRAFLTVNPRTGEMLYRVRSDANHRPIEDDLRREVLRSVVVRLDAER